MTTHELEYIYIAALLLDQLVDEAGDKNPTPRRTRNALRSLLRKHGWPIEAEPE